MLRSWMTMRMFGVAENMMEMANENMKRWDAEFIGRKQRLGKVNIRCGILHGDKFSPLLFALVMIPFSMILLKVKMTRDLGKKWLDE